MFKSYIRISIRRLFRDRIYGVLNILGLVTGLVSGIFMFLYVLDEISYDKHFANYDRIYRVALATQSEAGEKQSAVTVPPLGQRMKAELPEVEEYATFTKHTGWEVKLGDKRFIEQSVFVFSRDALKVLDFELKIGNPKTVFSKPNSALISESRALKFFGSTDVIGHQIPNVTWGSFTITGVLADPPMNSHIQPHLVLYRGEDHFPSDGWNKLQFYNYVLLADRTDPNQLQDKLSRFYDAYLKGPLDGEGRIFLQKVTDIHLHSKLRAEIQPGGDYIGVMVISTLGFFVILVASINYMNMSTTQAVKRTKEIGIRTALGSNKAMLRVQFLTQSVFITSTITIVALVLVVLLMPYFNMISYKNLAIGSIFESRMTLILLVLVIIVGAAGGAYPGLVVSRFSIADIFRKKIILGNGHLPIGKVLNSVQFTVAIVALTLTWITYNQFSFIKGYNLGVDHHQVINVQLERIRPQQQKLLKDAILSNPNVSYVSFTGRSPGYDLFSAGGLGFEGPNGDYMKVDQAEFNTVDEDMVPLLGMRILAGRNLEDLPADVSGKAALVNETLVKSLGYLTAESAIGKQFKLPRAEDVGRIIGVVKDFHHRSLHTQIGPLVMVNFHRMNSTMLAKVNSKIVSEEMSFIDQKVKDLTGMSPLEITLMDQDFWNQYRADERQRQLLTLFSWLTILIASLGLVSLVAYTVESKSQEITIRKVFGAKLYHILSLLTKQYAFVIIISVAVAIPISILLGREWLNNFAYRINLGFELFATPVAVSFLLMILVLYSQSQHSFSSNPVDKLHMD